MNNRVHLSAFVWLLAVQVHAEETKGNNPTWQPLGPAPIESNGGNNVRNVGTNDPASGAIHAVAAHPSNPNIVYVGAVNGGVWRTNNALSASPSWVQQTDDKLSSSIGDVAFDPADPSGQTLVAGFGRFSSLSFDGGSREGMIRTTNGGATWTSLGAQMQNRNIAKVAANGNIIVAAVDIADPFFCNQEVGILRSTDTGATWNVVTNGIVGGSADALAQHPNNPAVLYASMTDLGDVCGAGGDGIYRSSNTGQSWTKVSSAAMDALILNVNNISNHFEIAVAPTGTVFVGIVTGSDGTPGTGGRLSGVFRSENDGASWQQMDLPGTNEPGFFGIHPGAQGNFHFSMAADPTNDNLVYVGGDRQPNGPDEIGPFGVPNAVGACGFAGRLFRGDASAPSGSQWTPITHNGAKANGVPAGNCGEQGTAPHPDSRDMAFDVNGNLLETDDGGIYRRQSPRSSTGIWVDVNGDLQLTEQYSGKFDRNSSIAISGNQDNGTSSQRIFSSTVWASVGGGDGGDVVIDYLTIPNNSVRYISSQNLGSATRLQYDAQGNFIGFAELALNVTQGSALQPKFVTPLATNNVAGGRLIIGGANGLYESFDRGDSLAEIAPGIVANNPSSIRYGVTGNAEQLLVAAGVQVGLRTSSNGPLNLIYTSAGPNNVAAVAMDPGDGSRLFVVDNNTVQFSSSGGAQFSDVTGALVSNFSPGLLRTVSFMQRPDDAIAVGADRGVFIATESGGFSNWSEAGAGLPTAPVSVLDYDAATDRLVAFTIGRGSFVLDGGAGGIAPQQFCSTPGVGIPDNTPAGLNDNLSVSASGTITNLTVTLEVTHTWVGDIRATLRNVSSGTEIALLSRSIGGSGNCNIGNINTVFADSSSLPASNQCNGTPPAISGTVRPDQALAVFNNASISGNWTLNISDNEAQDIGTLNRWCLQATLDAATGGALIFEDSFEN